MPNYCENDLYIEGEETDVQEVLKFIGALDDPNPKFDFNAVIPYPKKFVKMDAEMQTLRDKNDGYHPLDGDPGVAKYIKKWGTSDDGFNAGGYAWRCENWGVKWNAEDFSIKQPHDGYAKLTFTTAWDAPTPIIIALAKRFPRNSYTFEYFEGGAEFCGGFAIYAKDNVEEGEPYGITVMEWHCNEYKGNRGG